MKELSDWQSARMRDALRAYHCYERGSEGEFFTWKDVREAIAVYTDVEIGTSSKNGAERLRQFVEGIEDVNTPNSRKFPAPKPAALEAIIAFVTHEELNLLNENELKEYTPDFQAHLRLLEYLDESTDEERLILPVTLEGRYRSPLKYDESKLIVRELTLQRSTKSGLIQVIETEEIYDPKITASQFSSLTPEDRAEALRIRHYYGGWTVLTPEYNLFFFMKEAKLGKNRYYFTLGSDLRNPVESGYVTFLILLHHDHLFDTEKGKPQIYTKMVREITADIPERILAFMRVY